MIAKRILNQEETEELYGVFQQATIGDCNDWKIISRHLQFFGTAK